jgi:hypothetical protein
VSCSSFELTSHSLQDQLTQVFFTRNMDRFRENHFGFRIPMITLPIGCVFQLISLVSPYWINADFIILNVHIYEHIGLWKTCLHTQEASDCSSPTNLPGNIQGRIQDLWLGGVSMRGVWGPLKVPSWSRGTKPPWSSGDFRNYRHLFERQFWTNHTIFIRPKKLDFNWVLILSDNCY